METLIKNNMLALAWATALLLFSSSAWAQDKRIVIGSGGLTGVYYPVAVSICRLFNAEYSSRGYKCSVESTNGSVENLRRLRAGEINFAIVQSDWQSHAYKGTNIFSESGPFEKLRSLFALYSESFTILARASSNITNFENLRGRRVNIGNQGSGQRATMEVVMRALGWSRFDFALTHEFNSDLQAEALCDGEVDVIIFVAGHPSGTIKSATEKCDTNFVDVEGPEFDALVDENDYYRKVMIPVGLYRGQLREIPTFGLSAAMVATSEASPGLIDIFLKSVFRNLDKLKKSHPALANLQEEEMKSALPAPFHDAAKSFYDESVD